MTLDDARVAAPDPGPEVLALDGALQALAKVDERKARVAVAIAPERGLVVGRAEPLFTSGLPWPTAPGGSPSAYDVTADGQRFLISGPPGETPRRRVIVVPDWAAGLKRD